MFENVDDKTEYVAFFLSKTIEMIHNNYYYDISYEELYNAAINGMTNALDNYSIYLTKNNSKSNSNNISNTQQSEHSIYDYYINRNNKKIKVIIFKSVNEKSYVGFKEILEDIKKNNVKDIIIDLRNNPGGFPDYVHKICNLVVSQGIIFSSINKDKKTTYYESNLKEKILNQIVVLTNNKTMSAAELLASVLQDDGSFVIGEKTYGKGVAQTQFSIYGGCISLTTEEYFTKNKSAINNIGVTPNLIVSDTKENDCDKVLEVAVNYIVKNK